jgi:hypothetical protein
MTRLFVMVIQLIVAVLATPIVLSNGVLGAINLATQSNFNLRYQLHFAVTHFGTYVNAALAALIFWITGRIAARLLWSSRVPSVMTLLATLILALGLAHLSLLPAVAEINTAIYARFFTSVPQIAFPLAGCVLAALLVPGKRVT